MLPPPPRSTLFPYTTLFRSDVEPNPAPPIWVPAFAGMSGIFSALPAGGAEAAGLQGDGADRVAGGGRGGELRAEVGLELLGDRKSTRLNSSHGYISYAVFCL